MSKSFAVGKEAFGFCDRCGFRYMLTELKEEYRNLQRTGLRTCPECFDEDHPQLQLGRYTWDDPQALKDPRPDNAEAASRGDDRQRWTFASSTAGWVGQNATLAISGGSMVVTPTTVDPQIRQEGIALEASVFVYAQVRFSVSDRAAAQASWGGDFFWNRATEAYNQARTANATSPNFFAMGAARHEVVWPLSGVTNWSGTIEDIRFDLFNSDSVLWLVDEIRFEQQTGYPIIPNVP